MGDGALDTGHRYSSAQLLRWAVQGVTAVVGGIGSDGMQRFMNSKSDGSQSSATGIAVHGWKEVSGPLSAPRLRSHGGVHVHSWSKCFFRIIERVGVTSGCRGRRSAFLADVVFGMPWL